MSHDTRKVIDIPTLKNDIKLARLAQEKPTTKPHAEESTREKQISFGQESVYTA